MEREKDYIYLDINEGNRQIQKSRRTTNTIDCTTTSIYMFSISGFVSECKLMYSILYTGFLFMVLSCFCIYADEFIEKANKINFIDEGEYQ
ncbi:MAG: hypothetical protein LDL53_12440 [Candidatus Hydrogenedens sp.]|mgnify:CR=1 FL=1|nr:hypothetical protein [Candidatus Hydrogenedens sp.]